MMVCCAAAAAAALTAQPGWITGVDEASGHLYYYNEQTGHSQWEPPAQTTTTQRVQWILAPASGVRNEYTVRNREAQVLGRYDMDVQSIYVSREQCVVRVGFDGTASVLSTGKAPTVVCSPYGECYGLERGLSHVLQHGEQIGLKQSLHSNQEAGGPIQGIFTVYALPGDYEQEDDDAQLDDGGFIELTPAFGG